jgi:hypothetical protein
MGPQRLSTLAGKEYPPSKLRGSKAAAAAIGALKCYGPPRQLRTSRGLRLQERAQAISPRSLAWDPATLSSARRAGSGSSSAAALGALHLARRRPARVGPNGRLLVTLGPRPRTKAPTPSPLLAVSRRWRGGGRHGSLAKPRSERCDGSGSRTSAKPPAAGRSAIREAEISPIAASSPSRANPIAPAIAGWLIARPRQGRWRASGSAPLGVRGGSPEGRVRRLCADLPHDLLEHADQAGGVRARFAPR